MNTLRSMVMATLALCMASNAMARPCGHGSKAPARKVKVHFRNSQAKRYGVAIRQQKVHAFQ